MPLRGEGSGAVRNARLEASRDDEPTGSIPRPRLPDESLAHLTAAALVIDPDPAVLDEREPPVPTWMSVARVVAAIICALLVAVVGVALMHRQDPAAPPPNAGSEALAPIDPSDDPVDGDRFDDAEPLDGSAAAPVAPEPVGRAPSPAAPAVGTPLASVTPTSAVPSTETAAAAPPTSVRPSGSRRTSATPTTTARPSPTSSTTRSGPAPKPSAPGR